MYQTNTLIREEMKKNGFYDITPFPHSRFSKDVYGWDGVAKIKLPSDYNVIITTKDDLSIVWYQNKTGYCSNKIELIEFCKNTGEKGLIAELIKYKEKYKNKKGSYTKKEVRLTPVGFSL
jgi:hypothetical protein